MKECNFECLYELGGLCLLDKEPCISDCDRNRDCRFCERGCSKEEGEKYE